MYIKQFPVNLNSVSTGTVLAAHDQELTANYAEHQSFATDFAGETEPQFPIIYGRWLDTSTTPPVLKRWNGSEWEDALELQPLIAKTIFASKYSFSNGAGDAAKFKTLVETTTANILYIDTNICIDTPIRVDLTNLSKIVGMGGTIKLTNKVTSLVPTLEFEYCNNLIFENIAFVGDVDKTLTSDTLFANNIVSPLFLSHCDNDKVINCSFTGIISAAAVLLRYCNNILVKNNSIVNCWNHIEGDLQGDGVYVGHSSNVIVADNYIHNAFATKDNFGRVGVCFESAETANCICSNNHIYGYDRAIHIELGGCNIVIENNNALGCAMGFVCWQANNKHILVKDNYFSNIGVPTDYVAQLLQGTRGFISFFSNDTSVETNKNSIFRGNTCILEVDITGIEKFVCSKISGESFIGNTFTDKNRTKEIYFYNPNEVTINNNNLDFSGNSVDCAAVKFAQIGKHRINGNTFNVPMFAFKCDPINTLGAVYREFKNNTIKNEVNNAFSLVNNYGYLFLNKISLFCKDNVFVDIKKQDGYNDCIFQTGQDYSASPHLKSIIDNNTLINTQTGAITKINTQQLDNCANESISNKIITNDGVSYTSLTNSNKCLVVTAPDGSERIITVGASGVLAGTTVQKWK